MVLNFVVAWIRALTAASLTAPGTMATAVLIAIACNFMIQVLDRSSGAYVYSNGPHTGIQASCKTASAGTLLEECTVTTLCHGCDWGTHRLGEAAAGEELGRHVGHCAIRLRGDVCLLVHIQNARQPKVRQLRRVATLVSDVTDPSSAVTLDRQHLS